MTEEIQQLLKALHLRKITEIFDDELALAEKEDRSYQELLVRLLRTRLRGKGGESRLCRPDRSGQDGTSLGAAPEGSPERPSWTLRARARSLRRDVRFARRPIESQAHRPLDAHRCPRGGRDGLPQPQTRADEHLLQAHGGALPAPLH